MNVSKLSNAFLCRTTPTVPAIRLATLTAEVFSAVKAYTSHMNIHAHPMQKCC